MTTCPLCHGDGCPICDAGELPEAAADVAAVTLLALPSPYRRGQVVAMGGQRLEWDWWPWRAVGVVEEVLLDGSARVVWHDGTDDVVEDGWCALHALPVVEAGDMTDFERARADMARRHARLGR